MSAISVRVTQEDGIQRRIDALGRLHIVSLGDEEADITLSHDID